MKGTYEEFCNKSQENIEGEEGKEKIKDKSFNAVISVIEKQDCIERETMIDIINHAVWLWALPNDKKAPWVLNKGQKNGKKNTQDNQPQYCDELRNIKGVAGGGQGYLQKKTNGIRFILFLFKRIYEISDSSIENAKIIITNSCSGNENSYEYPIPDGVKNLLVHLCDPEKYGPVAATSDKKKIVKAFWDYLESDKPTSQKAALKDLDNTIVKIKKLLSGDNKDFSFYANSLPLLWKGENDNDLSLVQQLEYKKAMILYGPPGTSKTYTANELAISVIFRDIMKNNKNVAIDLLKKGSLKDSLKERIKKLQFHINYNYEDFVAGQTIIDGNVKTRKGFIFDVVNQSQTKFRDDIEKCPYVVILDEINRTDISRVFGELFSAIEDRDKPIDLMLMNPDDNDKKLQLAIPNNIYFIGTMNEIDFSLERIDFALRRRFIWELHDYKEETIKEIIDFKLNKAIEDNRMDDFDDISAADIENFSKLCTKLNEVVEKELGEAYHVGHTFFAEIADIYVKLKENNADNPWDKAKVILWKISIKPTLEAYCGTMEKEYKRSLLEKPQKGNENRGGFYNAFFTKEELGTIENDTANNGEE